jgi:hypothetical protein
VDATDISTALSLFGVLLGFVGTVVTGVGLWFGWRRSLLRRSEDLRASLQGAGVAAIRANATGEGSVKAPVTGIEGQGDRDAPVTRAQLDGAIISLQAEIQKLLGDLHLVRTDIAGLPKVTDADVEKQTRQRLAEHEHRESSVALHDLSFALVGVGITALGSVVAIVGLFVGWY